MNEGQLAEWPGETKHLVGTMPLAGERTRPAGGRGRLGRDFPLHLSAAGLGERKMEGRSFWRDARNHTPEACAPRFQMHRSGL